MKNIILFGFIVTSFLASCTSDTAQNDTDSTTSNSESNVEETSSNQFGDVIDQKGSITYDELLANLAEKDSLQTKVTGKVSAV